MPPRIEPTARQERLGTELRKLREAAGMTAREAAALLGTNPIQMSHMETGRAGVSEERLRRLAAHYACPDPDLVDGLVSMATDRTRGWWEDYRGVLPSGFHDLAELEHHATFLRTIGVVHVPGILQTEDYARAVYSYMVPELPQSELEPRIEHRLRRRAVIQGHRPKLFATVVHESALRIRVGSRRTARNQLEALLEASERDHVSLTVIPFDADGFAGANCSMLHVGGPVPALDTVQLDAPVSGVLLDAESQLNRYRLLFRKVAASALDEAASRDRIHKLLGEL